MRQERTHFLTCRLSRSPASLMGSWNSSLRGVSRVVFGGNPTQGHVLVFELDKKWAKKKKKKDRRVFMLASMFSVTMLTEKNDYTILWYIRKMSRSNYFLLSHVRALWNSATEGSSQFVVFCNSPAFNLQRGQACNSWLHIYRVSVVCSLSCWSRISRSEPRRYARSNQVKVISSWWN